MIFRARHAEFIFPRPAIIMGVVNVTPDSFSDGGDFFETKAAVEHANRLVEQGAEIIDVGGESTRPRAETVPEEEEIRRVVPVIEALASAGRCVISIDTQKPGVARAALRAGAAIVNDIAANRASPEMWEVTAEAGAGYVLMHMQGTPQTMQANPQYGDVVAEVGEFFAERLEAVEGAGLEPEQVVLDVGIGFGKTLAHNLQLLRSLSRFRIHQRPMLLGASRKSFMGKLLGAEAEERLPASIACAAWAVQNGVQIIRTHDVAETLQAVRMTEAITDGFDSVQY